MGKRKSKKKNPVVTVKEHARELLDQMAQLGIPKDQAETSVAKHVTPLLKDATEILQEDRKKSNKKEEGW